MDRKPSPRMEKLPCQGGEGSSPGLGLTSTQNISEMQHNDTPLWDKTAADVHSHSGRLSHASVPMPSVFREQSCTGDGLGPSCVGLN